MKKMTFEEFKIKFKEAQEYVTGSTEEKVEFVQVENPSYYPNRSYADNDANQPEPYITERRVIPVGYGKDLKKALEEFVKLKKELNGLEVGDDSQEEWTKKLDSEIETVKTKIENQFYQLKVNTLLTSYRALIKEYTERLKSEYGVDLSNDNKDDDKENEQDALINEKLKEEKTEYDDQEANKKDPGPLLLVYATLNMISALDNADNSPKAKIEAWKTLYEGEEGNIIKADRGDWTLPIRNFVAIVELLSNLVYAH